MKLSYEYGSMGRRTTWHGQAFVGDGQAGIIAGAKDEARITDCFLATSSFTLLSLEGCMHYLFLFCLVTLVFDDVQRRR